MNIWNPAEFAVTSDQLHRSNYAILLLNQPILNEEYFESLWNKATLRISVDGGGNQWYSLYSKKPTLKLPTIACGDFDSITGPVMELFRKSSLEIIDTPDQDATDFTKALRILSSKINSDPDFPKMDKILAYCEPSGRFDQTMANVETLYLSTLQFANQQIFLVGSTNVTWLLRPPQKHHIKVSELVKMSHHKVYCSLIPIGCESIVTTTGLKWDLHNDVMAFGRLVSTSNEVANDETEEITVLCSHPIIWSLEIYRS